MSSTLLQASASTPCTRTGRNAKNPALSHLAPAFSYGVRAPTDKKWRRRHSTAGRSHHLSTLHCTLGVVQKAAGMDIRRSQRWPLDVFSILVRQLPKLASSLSGLAQCISPYERTTRPVKRKNSLTVFKTFKDYGPGLRCRLVAVRGTPVDCAVRLLHLRIDADQGEVCHTDFLRRRRVTAPMTDEKWLTDDRSRCTYRFTDMGKAASGKHASECECVLLDIEHRHIKSGQPPTKGVRKRLRGRISKFKATTRFCSREGRQTTIESCLKPCRKYLQLHAIGDKPRHLKNG